MKADKDSVTRLLKTARGQLDGILKMVEEDRYCMDISNQVMATEAILRKANKEILKAHMKGCVQAALESGDAEQKIDELVEFFDLNETLFEEDDVETIGGLVVKVLGHIADVGNTVSFNGLTFTVVEIDGARITKLQVYKDVSIESATIVEDV